MPKVVVPTGPDNEATVDEYDVARIEDRHISVPPPPIDTAFSPHILPVQVVASDNIGFYTFPLNTNDQPIRIVEKQPQGMSSKVTIFVIPNIPLSTKPAMILLANQKSYLQAANNDKAQSFSFPLLGPWADNATSAVSYVPPLVLQTRAEIWACAVNSAPGGTIVTVAVIVETFDLDSRMPHSFGEERHFTTEGPEAIVTGGGFGDTW